MCNDYAERNGILIVHQYVDRATTGTNDNREEFQQMLKDSDKKAWDYVLVLNKSARLRLAETSTRRGN